MTTWHAAKTKLRLILRILRGKPVACRLTVRGDWTLEAGRSAHVVECTFVTQERSSVLNDPVSKLAQALQNIPVDDDAWDRIIQEPYG